MNKLMEKNWFTAGMKTNQFICPPLKPGDELWGIYYIDRQHARDVGDPLLGVVAAPTKAAAESAAAKQGLSNSWASLLTPEQIKSIGNETREQLHVTTQPTTADLRTAIEVLRMLDGRINDHSANSVRQLPDTDLGEQYAAHLEAQSIEQSGHIQKVVVQLRNWREELMQRQSERVTQSV
jgi:hypothetical protein